MKPKDDSKAPKNYGRQKEGKTIKSLSLNSDLVKKLEEKAAAEGTSFSRLVSDLLGKELDQ